MTTSAKDQSLSANVDCMNFSASIPHQLRRIAATTCVLAVAAVGAVACSNAGSGESAGANLSQAEKTQLKTQTVENDKTGVATAGVFFPGAKKAIVVAGDAAKPGAVAPEQFELAKQAAEKARLPVFVNPKPETLESLDEIYPVGQVNLPEGSGTKLHDEITTDTVKDLPEDTKPDTGELLAFVPKTASAASKLNAAAAGVEVLATPGEDALATSQSLKALKDDRKIVAIGQGFGDLEAARETAKKLKAELPGGGATLIPGRRIVALYGHPSGPALGALGEQDPKASVARAQKDVKAYQPYSPEPVIPGFEIIATVASEFPGDDGDFSNEATVDELKPYVDAVTEAGGYAVIDLQPGTARFVDQAKRYEELLKRPNVGLALDPEWKLSPGMKPAQEVGHTDAAEINEVVTWLADLTAKENLPQKALVLHQFQAQMIRDREKVDTSRKEIQIVLHADGHGKPDEKMQTWDMLLKDLPKGFEMAWKNFLDEDTPLFTPEHTMGVSPRPWFVSFQ